MSDPARSIAAIYERYHQSLYRFCFSIVGNAEDAQDALQNAMLKAVRALPGEQREIQLKPWLYRIAHNESIEILRKRREQSQIDPELVASTAGPEETAATRERLRRLLADLAELPERQRAALVMRELAGLGFGEIGDALGTSEAVARQTVYEARLGLQQLEAGREMSCESVMRQISDADGRTMRRRDIRAHLRACADCRRFRDAIDGRSRDLAAIAPLPLAASAGILHALIGGATAHAAAGAAGTGAAGAGAAGAGAAGAGVAGVGAGMGAAGTIGVGAGKVVATSAVLKSAATVAVVATIGVSAADRTGVIDVGLPGDRGAAVAPSETASGGGSAPAAAAAVAGAGTVVTTDRPAAGKQHGGGAVPPNDAKGNAGANLNGATGPAGQHEGSEPGSPPADLPPASQHGQETAAAHRATPHANAPKGNGHGAAHSQGRGRSHGHAAKAKHTASRGRSHSQGGNRAQPSPPPQPPPQPKTESPQKQAPATTAPETQAIGGAVETSP